MIGSGIGHAIGGVLRYATAAYSLKVTVGNVQVYGYHASLRSAYVLHALTGNIQVTGGRVAFGNAYTGKTQLIDDPLFITFATPQGFGELVSNPEVYGDQLFQPGV